MKIIVIAGGNSGIGLCAAQKLLEGGHRVIILGRNRQKGEQALKSFGQNRDRASFLAADLSTNQGVRAAAERVLGLTNHIDGILHSTGVFETKDVRTSDGLALFFAVSYLGRYHLTELLLPALLLADRPRVVMMTAKIDPIPTIDLDQFPYFKPFNFKSMRPQVNAANLYYADHLCKKYPKLFAGAANAGFARTDGFRSAPWTIKAMVAILGPFFANSVDTSAHNPVQALLEGAGPAVYWNKPGKYDEPTPLSLNSSVREEMMTASQRLIEV